MNVDQFHTLVENVNMILASKSFKNVTNIVFPDGRDYPMITNIRFVLGEGDYSLQFDIDGVSHNEYQMRGDAIGYRREYINRIEHLGEVVNCVDHHREGVMSAKRLTAKTAERIAKKVISCIKASTYAPELWVSE